MFIVLFIYKTSLPNSDTDWSKNIPEIDQQLYVKYHLTDEEIAFIESIIKPTQSIIGKNFHIFHPSIFLNVMLLCGKFAKCI